MTYTKAEIKQLLITYLAREIAGSNVGRFQYYYAMNATELEDPVKEVTADLLKLSEEYRKTSS